jgi:putative ABC transport system substrate-binding protein
MRRRELIALLGGAAALLPAYVRAEGTAPARLGYIWIGARGTDPSNLPGLGKGLAERGYVVGKTIVIEERYADGHDDRVPGLVAELLALKVDVLLTPGSPITLAAKRATSTLPIVSFTGDPVGLGLAASLSRPGGNVTGIAVQDWVYSSKWLGLLKEVVPNLRRVGALWSEGNPGIAPEIAQLRRSAGELGLEFVALSTRRDDVEASLSKISAGGFDALIVTDDPTNEALVPRLISLAAASHLPALYGFNTAVQQGGLISYSVDRFELWHRQAAGYVDRILKGASPADLPIEQPSTIALGVNLATAKQLGLAIPHSILARADEVVE